MWSSVFELKKSIIQGQLMWKRSGSFSWLLSKIHIQQINLFSFLGIHFTTSSLCLKLAFYRLFVYMYTWISVYSYPLLIESSFFATYFLEKDLTFVPIFFLTERNLKGLSLLQKKGGWRKLCLVFVLPRATIEAGHTLRNSEEIKSQNFLAMPSVQQPAVLIQPTASVEVPLVSPS